MTTDIHPKCVAAKQIATIEIVLAVQERSINHLGGQKLASCIHFLPGGICLAASGVEAEGGTGYRMVEATCHR